LTKPANPAAYPSKLPQLDKELAAQLRKANSRVNHNPHYRVELAPYSKAEFWRAALPQGNAQGECEDYALAKQKELLQLGWPPACLRLAVCAAEGQAAHCVLTVDTAQGVYVLSNYWPDPETPQMLDGRGYRFVSRQSAEHGDWGSLAVAGPRG
jgi:predicted transglutaminase-like cysteine proteinase